MIPCAVLLVLTSAAINLWAQDVAADAIHTGRWTLAEQKQFSDCVAQLKAQGCKPANSRECSTPPEAWCEVGEEWRHWMSAHPEMAGKERSHAKFHQCTQKHAAQMNGTPKQFYAAFDLCAREAYGLETPK